MRPFEPCLEFSKVRRLGGREMWRHHFYIVDVITVRDHLREFEQVERLGWLCRIVGEERVKTPGGNADALQLRRVLRILGQRGRSRQDQEFAASHSVL